MTRTTLCLVAVGALCTLYAVPAMAQRGMGDTTGIARQVYQGETEKPEIETLTGTLVAVESKPCENTTGRAFVGTHLLIEEDSESEPWNVHLGPKAVIEEMTSQLKVGEAVTVKAFRTEQMKQRHYVAQTLNVGNQEEAIQLRDETLRPVWAGGAARGATQAWGRPAWGGRGQGRGCPAWGRGRGGRGSAWGAGPRGQGRGGFGQAQGQGRGRGRGQGRGRGWGGYRGGGRGQGGYRQGPGW